VLITIDWGSSRRRALLLSPDGVVIDERTDDRGVLSMGAWDYKPAICEMKGLFGDHPIVMSGMVGSRSGWVEVPYVPAPATLIDLARAATRLAVEDLLIVPGVSYTDGARADVMRGEEVLALGAHAAGMVPDDALICQPGTHNKWIDLQSGHITAFKTAMTGEIFAMLSRSGTLAPFLQGSVRSGAPFRDGVEHSLADQDLLSALFGARANVLLGRLNPEDAASYVSGLLIGSDVAANAVAGDREVFVLGEEPLAGLYVEALIMRGANPVPLDSRSAFVAGIMSIWNMSCRN
jgi:2-dehydro-3-deoxygalactonokinase